MGKPKLSKRKEGEEQHCTMDELERGVDIRADVSWVSLELRERTCCIVISLGVEFTFWVGWTG